MHNTGLLVVHNDLESFLSAVRTIRSFQRAYEYWISQKKESNILEN